MCWLRRCCCVSVIRVEWGSLLGLCVTGELTINAHPRSGSGSTSTVSEIPALGAPSTRPGTVVSATVVSARTVLETYASP